jgi:hypothetical protein
VEFPSEVLTHIGSFWCGKDLSTYLLAAASSKELMGSHNTSFTNLIKCIGQRCLSFLDSIKAPDSMKRLVLERMEHAIRQIEDQNQYNMQIVSEWCALIDYCELIPLRLSQARLEQDTPIQPLWIVGAGEFRAPNEEPSSAILSVPSETWRPELIFLGEKWMVDYAKSNRRLHAGFIWELEYIARDIGRSAAVMSWKDSRYLAYIHQVHDIEAGFMVYHQFPYASDDTESCTLNWLSKAYCEGMMTRSIRPALGRSSLKWMAEGTKWDNEMLAFVEFREGVVPYDHMQYFSENVINLLHEVENWMEVEYNSDSEE